MFVHWQTYALAVCGLASVFLAQNAFHAGPIAASQTALVLVDPLVSLAIGIGIFGDDLRTGGAYGPLEAVSLLVMFVGAVYLAQSPLISGMKGDDDSYDQLLSVRSRSKRLARAVEDQVQPGMLGLVESDCTPTRPGATLHDGRPVGGLRSASRTPRPTPDRGPTTARSGDERRARHRSRASTPSPTGRPWWSGTRPAPTGSSRTRPGVPASALAAAGVGPGDRVALVDLGGALPVATILAVRPAGGGQRPDERLPHDAASSGSWSELVGARVGVAGDAVHRRARRGRRTVRSWAGRRRRRRPGGGAGHGRRTRRHRARPVHQRDDRAAQAGRRSATGCSPTGWPTTASPSIPDAAQVVDMMSAPIFHIGGTLGLFVSLHQGKQLVVLPRVRRRDVARAQVERHRVAQTFVVPTMLRRILDHPDFATTDLELAARP